MSGFFQIAVTEQHLDGAQVRPRFEEMRGKTMAQSVGMDGFVEARALGAAKWQARQTVLVLRGSMGCYADGRQGNSHALDSARCGSSARVRLPRRYGAEHHIAIFCGPCRRGYGRSCASCRYRRLAVVPPRRNAPRWRRAVINRDAIEGVRAELISRATSS